MSEKITKEEFAAQLTGRPYPFHLSGEEKKTAYDSGLVAVYGASDDLMEFEGAINDEVGAWEGATAYLADGKLLKNECGDEDCPFYAKLKEKAKTIRALDCPEGLDMSWAYETEIPHSTFLIMEDDETYCRGIVFSIADIGG